MGKQTKQREAPSNELFIHGEVESWHVLMVSHDHMIEVTRDKAQYKEELPDGGTKYTHRAVSDHLELELTLRLRETIRGFDQLHFTITEWEAEEYGGIAGELSYDKESGMRGGVHMSGTFPRDFYQLLLSERGSVMAIETERGFFRRVARITSLAFADAGHQQWTDVESSLI